MAAGACAHPFGPFVGGLHCVGATPLVSDLLRDGAPPGPVSGARSGECVSNFMQQDLGDLSRSGFLGEVARHRDAVCSVITLTEARGRAIKAKRPDPRDLVGGKKPLSLLLYPRRICHVDRVAGARTSSGSYPQGVPQTQSRQIVINAYTLKVCFPDFLCRHIADDTRAPSIAAG